LVLNKQLIYFNQLIIIDIVIELIGLDK